ncbi:transmembrane protein [Anaeramoeba flamelloides]|uniref:Transmembrane protein n=1 Tax=Anaeramoeba flamelloides TaxID=1746091 RepID=A0ABQ8X9I1_9EUKA|nr:transmembrane protein [Anaeramoeba flamelloides]
METKVDHWKKRHFVFFFLLFFIFIIAGIFVGFTGPEVYKTKELHFKRDITLSNFSESVTIVKLNRLNQFLFVNIHFQNNGPKEESMVSNFTLDLYGINNFNNSYKHWEKISSTNHIRKINCLPNSNCTEHTLVYEPYLHYKNYHLEFNVNLNEEHPSLEDLYIEFNFINKSMTYFELFMRYTFLIITIISISYFLKKIKKIAYSNLNIEQKWICWLLLLLIFFNNPIYPTIILSHSRLVSFLNGIFTATFLITISGFWLCNLDGIRLQAHERTFSKFYLPKCIPLAILWFLFFIIYIWSQIHPMDDPQYEAAHDIPGFFVIEIIIICLYGIYFLWSIFVTIRSFKKIGNSPQQKKRFCLFFSLAFLVLIFTILTIYGRFITKIKNTSGEFMATYTIYNVYLLFYTYSILPASTVQKEIKIQNNGAFYEHDTDSLLSHNSIDESDLENNIEMKDQITDRSNN